MAVMSSLDPPTSAQFLQGLGFLLTPDGGGEESPAYLLVALRGEPTLRHFDPERVEYWMDLNGRGQSDTFNRLTKVPIDGPFSWGPIRIVDRLEVSNEYLSFGGRLSAARLDGFTVAVFASPAPIVRSGGHSQSRDPSAPSVTAFFARMRAAAGSSRAIEERITRASPQARYAAYLADACGKYRASHLLQSMYPQTCQSLMRQERRLRAERPAAWAEGRSLLPSPQAETITTQSDKEALHVGG